MINHILNAAMFNKPNPFGNCTLAQIEHFEQKYSIDMPKDYKNYLHQFNGAEPINKICSLNNDGETSVHHMYGLHHIDWCNIQIANNMLLFADDVFGNEFAISLNQENHYGCVYFIDREREDEIMLISQSFNDFISSLISEDVYMENLKNEAPEIYTRIQEFKKNPQI